MKRAFFRFCFVTRGVGFFDCRECCGDGEVWASLWDDDCDPTCGAVLCGACGGTGRRFRLPWRARSSINAFLTARTLGRGVLFSLYMAGRMFVMGSTGRYKIRRKVPQT